MQNVQSLLVEAEALKVTGAPISTRHMYTCVRIVLGGTIWNNGR